MKLNDKTPGLPEWPPIVFIEERNEYVVGAPHLSYKRYDLVRKTTGSFIIIGFLLSSVLAFAVNSDFGALAILCLVVFAILSCFPLMKFLFERFFSVDVPVRFIPGMIIVNKKKFENTPNIPVQFRAQRTPLTDEQLSDIEELRQQKKLPKSRAYDLKFRKIEMIYGSRLVDITSVADEDRAAQFALALQIGCDMARTPQAASARKLPAIPTAMGDSLPE